jgi:GcrA cell cycle regulator
MTHWTEDRIQRLTALWRDGHTAAFIARALGEGVSRNAVLGKLHRMKLWTARSQAIRRGPRPGARRRPDAAEQPVRTPARLGAPRASPSSIPGVGLRTILTVGRGECRWPIGEPSRADFRLCGCAVARGAFCGPHADRAYRRAPGTIESLVKGVSA